MSHIIKTSTRCVLAVLTLALLAGCDAGVGELEQWVAQEKSKRGAPLPPPPVLKTFENFEYTAQDLRDPFAAGVSEEAEQEQANGPRPDQNRVREPLELYPLDGLRMVGTLGLTGSAEGLLKDPEGVIHRVRTGNYLGQNYGRITAIGEDHIEVVELIPNGTGGWMERQASISLADANTR